MINAFNLLVLALCCAYVAEAQLTPCPDGSYCGDGQTCCQLSSGGYGCCPYPSATCCSDELHCCPQNYKCDVSAGTCTANNPLQKDVKMLEKVKPIKQARNCPGCPFPNGVCCPGGQTCCPQGTRCSGIWCIGNLRATSLK